MGNVQNKCSCLCNKDEKDETGFEKRNFQTDPPYVETQEKKNLFKEQILKKKEKSTNPNGNSKESMDEDKRKDNERNATNSNKKQLIVPKLDLEDPKRIRKAKIVQKWTRGHLIRKKFTQLKIRLMEHTNKIIEKYRDLFKTPTLYRAESFNNTEFDKDGWTRYYALDTPLFKIDYGRVLFDVKIRIYEDMAYYAGNVNLKGEKHGHGTLINKNGVKYQGSWVNNVFTGWGRLIDSDGNLFEGYFENCLLNGKGEKYSLSGSVYKGDFKNGMKDGIGEEETSEHIYVGQYKNDKKEGKGKLIYKAIKDVYDGEFKENCITGYGFYTWANKDTYQGTFFNGKMHGKGLYKWPDGGEYIGDYINNIKEGFGKFKWSNGKIFEGPFKNGRPHGIGKLAIENEVYDVEFKDGKLVQTLAKKNSPNNSTIKIPQ